MNQNKNMRNSVIQTMKRAYATGGMPTTQQIRPNYFLWSATAFMIGVGGFYYYSWKNPKTLGAQDELQPDSHRSELYDPQPDAEHNLPNHEHAVLPRHKGYKSSNKGQ